MSVAMLQPRGTKSGLFARKKGLPNLPEVVVTPRTQRSASLFAGGLALVAGPAGLPGALLVERQLLVQHEPDQAGDVQPEVAGTLAEPVEQLGREADVERPAMAR